MLGIDTISNLYLKHHVKKQLKKYYKMKGINPKEIEKLGLLEIKESMKLLNDDISKKVTDYHYMNYLKKENEALRKQIEKPTEKKIEKPIDKKKEEDKNKLLMEQLNEVKEHNQVLQMENASLSVRNKALIETFSRREDIKDLTKNIKQDLTRQQLLVSKTISMENDLKTLKESVRGKQLEKAKV